MRRALAILKYVPAVLCGLLVVAWVGSNFFGVVVQSSALGYTVRIWCVGSSVGLAREDGVRATAWRVRPTHPDHVATMHWLGDAKFASFDATAMNHCYLVFPLPALVTFLLPFATGHFVRFRFPLWSYFAWTALIAAELAYYLR